jgi:hypothetical protein
MMLEPDREVLVDNEVGSVEHSLDAYYPTDPGSHASSFAGRTTPP